MKILKLSTILGVFLSILLLVACKEDEPKFSRLSSSVWTGEILKNRNGEDVIEYTVNVFFKENNILDLVLVNPNNSLAGRFENTPYSIQGKVFTMNVEEGYWPRVMLRQSWFVARLSDTEFVLEQDGGYRKMFLKRNR